MEEIILNDCLKYLKEAQRYLNMYEEIDAYSEIFEASNPDVIEKARKNQIAQRGTTDNMMKSSNALSKMIQNIILAIKNFFGKRNIDGATRAALQEYRKKSASNPSLKNKKINCLDINKFTADGDAILKEAEAIDDKLKRGIDVDTHTILSQITKYCGGAAAGLVVPIGIEAALQAASSSKEMASKMLSTLENDANLQKQIESAIGKGNAKEFKKDLHALTGKRIGLRQAILRMKGYQAESVEDAINKTINSVSSLIGGGTDIASIYMKDEDANDLSRSKLGDTIHTIGYTLKNGKKIKQATDSMGESGKRMAKNMLGNKEIKSGIKSAADIYGNAKDEAKASVKAEKDAEKAKLKAAKAAEKYGKDVNKNKANQSMYDSMFGVNDRNASVSNSKTGQTARKIYDKLN